MIYYCNENDTLYTENSLQALFSDTTERGADYAAWKAAALDNSGALRVIDTDFNAARGLALDFSASGATLENVDKIARGLYAAGLSADITQAVQTARADITASAAESRLAEKIRLYIAARRLEIEAEKE